MKLEKKCEKFKVKFSSSIITLPEDERVEWTRNKLEVKIWKMVSSREVNAINKVSKWIKQMNGEILCEKKNKTKKK